MLKKKTKAGGITIPNSSLYYKAVIIKTAWYWHKNRHIDQWNRIGNPELDPQMYGQLLFDKAGQMEKRQSLWQMVQGELDSNMQKNKTGPLSYTKINSKWMKDLNVRQEIIKILKDKTGSNLFDLGHSNFLLDTSPETTETKAKMNYWELIKIKSFCTYLYVKETINKIQRQPTEWEKILANDISDRGLVSKICK